jgi:hypothetical protein
MRTSAGVWRAVKTLQADAARISTASAVTPAFGSKQLPVIQANLEDAGFRCPVRTRDTDAQ